MSKERLYRLEKKNEVILDDTKTPAGVGKLVLTNRLKRALIEYYNEFYETTNLFPITTGNDDFLFIYQLGKTKGYPVRARSTNTAWDRIIKKSGLPKIKIHDGRHTHAVRLRQAGVPLEDIKDLLGHRDVKMTQVYAHVSPEVKIKAIGKLDKYLDNKKGTL